MATQPPAKRRKLQPVIGPIPPELVVLSDSETDEIVPVRAAAACEAPPLPPMPPLEEPEQNNVVLSSKRKPRAPRSAHWFITINYADGSPEEIRAKIDADVGELKSLESKYIVVGEHVGNKTGRRHIHCYVHMKSATTFAAMKVRMPRANIQTKIQDSSPTNCRDYCAKDGKILLERGCYTCHLCEYYILA